MNSSAVKRLAFHCLCICLICAVLIWCVKSKKVVRKKPKSSTVVKPMTWETVAGVVLDSDGKCRIFQKATRAVVTSLFVLFDTNRFIKIYSLQRWKCTLIETIH